MLATILSDMPLHQALSALAAGVPEEPYVARTEPSIASKVTY